jgi:hypothetical protein
MSLLNRIICRIICGEDVFADAPKSEYQKRKDRCKHAWGTWTYSGAGRSYRVCSRCGCRQYD